AVVGESVNKHITRLRLERAASYLRYSSWQAGEIAQICGFTSQSNFGRGFRKIYGMSPQEFRKAKGTVPFLRGYARSRPGLELEQNSAPRPTVRIEDWPELQAICLRYYGPMDGVIQPWRELLSWAKEEYPMPEKARFFGIWFDDWTGHSERYRYECAIVSPSVVNLNPPEPFHVRTIPGGTTAVAEARGNGKELEQAWHSFGTGWLPFSGYQVRGDFVFDEYPADLILSHWKKLAVLWKGLSLRMCVPVQTEPVEV
ncbi:MAG: GyrI-like domain-containing protein, partial [Verrucomicrobiota bacterium]